jgi:hypothetical protein
VNSLLLLGYKREIKILKDKEQLTDLFDGLLRELSIKMNGQIYIYDIFPFAMKKTVDTQSRLYTVAYVLPQQIRN